MKGESATKPERRPEPVGLVKEYVRRVGAWQRFQRQQGLGTADLIRKGTARLIDSGIRPSKQPTAAQRRAAKKKRMRSQKMAQGLSAANDASFVADAYHQWIDRVEATHCAALLPVSGPMISVIVPVFNPPTDAFIACIESVLEQRYRNWELILVDDCSTDQAVSSVIARYASQDARIVDVSLEHNGHICKASQAGLNVARGDFIALLDHDDLLPERALARMALEALAHPEMALAYSDEDKIDSQGTRYDAHFKSDWNPQLLLSQNYICHLMLIRRELAIRVGGFRVGFEGSQDHDLCLRCTGELQAEQIRHVPEVLYHWRAIEGSTALHSDQKDYTNSAGLRAVSSYLESKNISAEVLAGAVPNSYRVRYQFPQGEPSVCLVIPTRDQKDITALAISSILDKTDYSNYEILLVDNGSTEPDALAYFAELDGHPKVRVLRYDHPFNYSAINNFAVDHTDADIIGLVNNDVEVIGADWLTEMASLAAQPENGCVGAKLYYPQGKIQHAGVILGIGGVAGHSHKYYPKEHKGYFSRLTLTQNLSAVTAACLLVRRDIYKSVQGLDAESFSVAFNDVDFCLRVREEGYLNVWTPHAELYHHESISRGEEDSPEKINRFNREVGVMTGRWGPELAADPYYSPHLSIVHEDFSIRTE